MNDVNVNVVIPPALTFLLPFIASMLSAWLRSSTKPMIVNGLIALASILITAIISLWLSGQWTGDFREATIFVLAYVALLMRTDYKVVINWLFYHGSIPAEEQPAPPLDEQNRPAVVPTKPVA